MKTSADTVWSELEVAGWQIVEWGHSRWILRAPPYGRIARTFQTYPQAIDYALQLAAGKTEK